MRQELLKLPTLPTDLLDRELNVGDYVVFHNMVYQILELYKTGYAKIMLWHPSKTTKPVKKYCKFLCKLPSEDMVIWKLKNQDASI